jgi:hypothetical protein
MRKPVAISLGMVAAAAMALGCKATPQQDVKACVDRTGKMVDESFCQAQPQTSSGQNPNDDHLLRDILIYRWVFGGNYNGGYVSGYAYHPVPNMVYVSPRSSVGAGIVSAGSSHAYGVSRGGFGGSFAGGEGGE